MALRATRNPAVALLCAAALALPWYYVGRTLANVKPVSKPHVPVTGIVWASRVFISRAEFRHWLHAHGAGYRLWSHRHPRAHRVLEANAH